MLEPTLEIRIQTEAKYFTFRILMKLREEVKLHTHFSCIFKTRWTIGISRPSTLNTTISPTRIGSSLLVRNKRSPRWKAGSMLPLKIKQKLQYHQILQTSRTKYCGRIENVSHELFFSIIYLKTTTIGLSLPVTTINPFQIMRADDTIMAKFRPW